MLARLLAYLGAVEERRLDLQAACSSLYDFCVRRLGMGEDEACRRVAASRLARRFPIALELIERGELHLTTLLLLRDHLTNENHAELLDAARGLGKSGVQHLIAERFPRPDAPRRIEPLPVSTDGSSVGGSGTGTGTGTGVGGAQPAIPARVEPLSPERYKVQFTASAELLRLKARDRSAAAA